MMQTNLSKNKQKLNYFLLSLKELRGTLILYSIILFISGPFPTLFSWMRMGDISRYQAQWSEAYDYRTSVGASIFMAPMYVMVIFLIIIVLNRFNFIHKKHGSDFYFALPVERGFMYFTRVMTGIIGIIVPAFVMIALHRLIVAISPAHVLSESDYLTARLIFVIFLIVLFIMYLTFVFVSTFAGTSFDTLIYGTALYTIIPMVFASIGVFYSQIPGGLGEELALSSVSYFSPLAIFFGMTQANSRFFSFGMMNSEPTMREVFNIRTIVWIGIAVVLYYIGKFIFKKRRVELNGGARPNNAYSLIMKIASTFSISLAIAYGISNEYNYSTWPNRSINFSSFLTIFTVASVVSFLIIQVILARGFKGFKKSLWQYGTVWAMLLFVGIGFSTGGFGFATRIPKEKKVSSISTTINLMDYDLNLNGAYGAGVTVELDDPEKIKNIIEAHEWWVSVETGVNSREKDGDSYSSYYRRAATFEYNLKGSSVMKRKYSIPQDEFNQFVAYFETGVKEYYEQYYQVNKPVYKVVFSSELPSYSYYDDEVNYSDNQNYTGANPYVWPELIDALVKDTEKTIALKRANDQEEFIGSITFEYEAPADPDDYGSRYTQKHIKVYSYDENLIAALKILGFNINENEQ